MTGGELGRLRAAELAHERHTLGKDRRKGTTATAALSALRTRRYFVVMYTVCVLSCGGTTGLK